MGSSILCTWCHQIQWVAKSRHPIECSHSNSRFLTIPRGSTHAIHLGLHRTGCAKPVKGGATKYTKSFVPRFGANQFDWSNTWFNVTLSSLPSGRCWKKRIWTLGWLGWVLRQTLHSTSIMICSKEMVKICENRTIYVTIYMHVRLFITS